MENVTEAFESTLRSRARDTYPVQWVGVGTDSTGRLLEYIAVEDEPDGWLIFHAMPVTKKVLIEVGQRGYLGAAKSTDPGHYAVVDNSTGHALGTLIESNVVEQVRQPDAARQDLMS